MPSFDRMSSDPTLSGTRRLVRRDDGLAETQIGGPTGSDSTSAYDTYEEDPLDKTVVRPYPTATPASIDTVSTTGNLGTMDPPLYEDDYADAYDSEEALRGSNRTVSRLVTMAIVLALLACVGLGALALTGHIQLPSLPSLSTSKPASEDESASDAQEDEAWEAEEQTWDEQPQEAPEEVEATPNLVEEDAGIDEDIPAYNEDGELEQDTPSEEQQTSADTTAQTDVTPKDTGETDAAGGEAGTDNVSDAPAEEGDASAQG